ncbi:Conserved oligomeric Golgi complex subunit-like protein [Hapsidospora chrysogenum ATCC 11550]|uniref:Conserved oligomeric Golgi complex subunit 2 n=1 Tax=Hapsidospora chrysogenum (strain ATCC 11550 / CBS 779.69 / DSM 880 / IAM 14645 / JCM 23072 / IMI 49137) TaxID=857340 RepID=A0A086SX36_HAPC1|nr:Conserved oligomeric Golgi complex subunit-like protein [Hapsidospora chrysogenum ATCC 11550]
MANIAAPKPSSRSTSAVFNLPSSTNTSSNSSDAGLDDDTPLPFPSALPRSDFLKPDFQPVAYLSALPHRHQTLEDLRSDLRERSSAISAELLELVNSNYTAFLSLGNELRGGDDRVEDVRVAMLGFRRAVEDVKGKVTQRREETAKLSDDLRDVRSSIEQGRKFLELSDRISALEERLALDSLSSAHGPAGAQVSSDEDDEDGEDEKVDGLVASSPAKLSASAHACRYITALITRMDQDHPFVIKQEERLTRCRNTLLLDLGNALREAKSAGVAGQDRVMKYLGIYRIIDAQGEAVEALKKR